MHFWHRLRLLPIAVLLCACGDAVYFQTSETADAGNCSVLAWYLDADGDGFGGNSSIVESCESP